MKLLFIGGTRFVGLAMVREALSRGHAVTCFHRGRAALPGAALPAGVHTVAGDRERDLALLAALEGGPWDATIDTCAYRPHEVQALAAALGGRGGRLVLVSSVSVYRDDIPAGADEGAALADTAPLAGLDHRGRVITGENYGALKVLCEEAARAADPRALILRPTYVIGPHDPTPRFPEWVRRFAAGGEVPVPHPAEAPIQAIDARDLAAFTIRALERGVAGTFNTASEPMPWHAFLGEIAAAVGPAGTRLVPIPKEEGLAKQAEDAGAFPMWAAGEAWGVGAVSAAAARAEGLRCRPVAGSARDVLAWQRATAAPPGP
jgi:2'-hydroxyisoflavone reductase